jgi:SAM-dependent methyltransferase
MMAGRLEITREELERIFVLKYGDPQVTGWGPKARWRAGYFNPDDHYEALLNRLVDGNCRWLDVGCGRDLFRSNTELGRLLAGRCRRLVGVDPDPTLAENPFVHEKVALPLEDLRPDETFNLVTMRMVAEHIENPGRVARVLAAATAPGGLVVVYTVNRFSPVPLLTAVVPFALHHPAKWILWRSARRDTFPTFFRMNTRTRLRKIFEEAGLREAYFAYLDDCRTTSGFKTLHKLELALWRILTAVGWRYPENCLLGVYQKPDAAGSAGP